MIPITMNTTTAISQNQPKKGMQQRIAAVMLRTIPLLTWLLTKGDVFSCMAKVAQWNTLPDRGTTSRQKELEGATNVKELTFTQTATGEKLKTLYVGVETQYELKNTIPSTLPFQSAAYAPRDGETYGTTDQYTID